MSQVSCLYLLGSYWGDSQNKELTVMSPSDWPIEPFSLSFFLRRLIFNVSNTLHAFSNDLANFDEEKSRPLGKIKTNFYLGTTKYSKQNIFNQQLCNYAIRQMVSAKWSLYGNNVMGHVLQITLIYRRQFYGTLNHGTIVSKLND